MSAVLKKAADFARRETVLLAAMGLAAVSAVFVPPSRAYAEYIDFRTLGLLFSLMAVTEGCRRMGIFERAAGLLTRSAHTHFQLVLALTAACFFASMAITNDVGLITFVALSLDGVCRHEGGARLAIPVTVMQTIAANLGSMLTPIGNPQNLYLYGLSGMRVGGFIKLMLPYTLLAGAMLAGWAYMLCRKKGALSALPAQDMPTDNTDLPEIHRGRLAMYAALFALCLLTVARVLPWQVAAAAALICTLAADRAVLKNIDWSLLLTFCGFFIFIGNVSAVPAFSGALRRFIGGRELFTAAAASQIISNVPCAILLSAFTDNVRALIVGTNIGGLGTLIASMASLISYKQICREKPAEKGRYLACFTAANAVFLLAMAVLAIIL
mgnify:CR=1 FL=1